MRKSAGRRVTVLGAAALVVLAGCSSAAKPPPGERARATGRPPGSAPGAASTSPAAVATSRAPLPIAQAGDSAIGGTVTAYDATHDTSAGYSSPASYDSVHVVGFTRTFSPAVSKTDVLQRIRAGLDLPADAVQVADLDPSTACDEVWFTSETLHANYDPHAYVFVSLKSAGAFSASAVTSAVLDIDIAGGPGSVGCP